MRFRETSVSESNGFPYLGLEKKFPSGGVAKTVKGAGGGSWLNFLQSVYFLELFDVICSHP